MHPAERDRVCLAMAKHPKGCVLAHQTSEDAEALSILAERGLVRIEPENWNWHDAVAFITDAGRASLER